MDKTHKKAELRIKGLRRLPDVQRRTRGSASLLWGLSSVDCGRGDYFIFFKCDGVAIFAVMRKVLICLNALRHLESLFSIRPKATLFLTQKPKLARARRVSFCSKRF